MARRSKMSLQKRQRELRKAEKAAKKRARRHGLLDEKPREAIRIVQPSNLVTRESSGAGDKDSDEPLKKQTE
jgi:hypothetical protein